MNINYTKLIALLATQVESSTQRAKPTNRTSNIVTCFRCGEKGHYSRDCLAERETPVSYGENSTQPTKIAKHNRRQECENHSNNDDDLYDQLIYKDEEVKETDRYFIEEMLKELSIATLEDEEESIEEKIKKLEVSEELTEKQQREAKELIRKEKEIFAQTVEELGQTERMNYVIDMGDAAPIKQNAYRAAPSIREFIKMEITQLKERGLICKSQSPWFSPIVVVPKKSEKLCLYIDYCKLNAVMKKNSYPLPCMDDLLETFSKARLFSSLDLLSGYWQLPINEKNKEKTVFVTFCGTYKFNVMSFGLCNAPASFQRLMDKILADYIGKFVVVYLDDINIYSKNFNEHLNHINLVFEKLKESGLKLNFEKCTFSHNKICFLGHIVGRDGIKPDESKIEKDEDQNYAFESLKRHLITAPHPIKDDNGKEFVVSYASRGLTIHEKNYAATDLEFITDHSALKWLKTSKLTEARQPIHPDNNEELLEETILQRTYELIEQLPQIRHTALGNIQQSQECQKYYHDTNYKLAPEFDIGEKIWMYDASKEQSRSRKFKPKWLGPYYIHD
ncbi:4990_t:CDS:2 [Dentiscutata erythropus]|uniref:4990_t:CDS:1 n=1 Tax=Dentiscutata erythropus TaxID=1348616 RepID=A0A9N8W897_9GLOM|nr:4990_t:CDS:2 [Dentiscutata erythropus]